MQKKIILAILLATLSACSHGVAGIGGPKASTNPVKNPPLPEVAVAPSVQMPALPDALRKRAERLPPLVDGTLKGSLREGADSDTRYNDLAFRHNAIIDAWDCVKDAVNNRDATKINKCLSK